MIDAYRRVASRTPASSEGSGTRSKLTASTELAYLYNEESRYDEAIPLLELVVEARKSTVEEVHLDVLSLRFLLALLYSKKYQFDEAMCLVRPVSELCN